MDIEQVNTVLSKALLMVKEGEADDLLNFLMAEGVADDAAEASQVEAFLDAVIDHVSEETGSDDEKIVEALVAVSGELAERGQLPDLFGMENPQDIDEEKWLEAVRDTNLVEGALHYLQASD